MQEYEFEVMENGLVASPTYLVADDKEVWSVEVAESEHPWEDNEMDELQR